MARAEDKAVVMKCINEITDSLRTLKGLIPCIITHSDEDAALMKKAFKATNQMLQFIEECDGDLGYLSEEFDIDKIIEEYPKIDKLFNGNSSSSDDEEGLPFN